MSTDKSSYLHKGVRVLKELKGHSLSGMSNQELCRATGIMPSGISRIMQVLIEEGLAERRSDGRFSLSIGMLQIAQSHANEMQRARDRINELQSRVAIGSQ